MSKHFSRTEAANHVLAIMGDGSPIARQLAESVLAEPDWRQDPPKKSGTYWHWNGDSDCCANPVFVGWSGIEGDPTFVQVGQLGIKEAINCDEFGGWWMELRQPDRPCD